MLCSFGFLKTEIQSQILLNKFTIMYYSVLPYFKRDS